MVQGVRGRVAFPPGCGDSEEHGKSRPHSVP